MAPVIYPDAFKHNPPQERLPADDARELVAQLDDCIAKLSELSPAMLAHVWQPIHHHTGMSGTVGIVAILDGMIARLEYEKRRMRLHLGMEARKPHYNSRGEVV